MLRKLPLLLCFITLLLFSGCGKTEEKQQPPTTTNQQSQTQTQDQPNINQQSSTENKETKEISAEATDIDGHPAEREINAILQKGVMKIGADGKFNPNNMLTRGEFIQWLYNFDSKGIKPHSPSTNSFKDLKADSPYFPVVEGLKAGGLLVGYPDGTIRTEKNLTREELTLIWGWYQQISSLLHPRIEPEQFKNRLSYKQDGNTVGIEYAITVYSYSDIYVSTRFKCLDVAHVA